MIIDDSSDSLWILEIESPRKKPVARMEACEAEGDDGASVFERAGGEGESALPEDPSGGAAAPPSAKEAFDRLVQEKVANTSVNCWTQAQVDTCITCLDGWARLEGWQRMERAREGYGEFTSKPYGWVQGAGFTVATAQDAEGKETKTLLADYTDGKGEAHMVRVVAIEEFYEALKEVHEDTGHSRGRPLEDKVKKRFAKVPRWASDFVVRCCLTCTMRPTAKPKTLAGSNPILVWGFGKRGQVCPTPSPTHPQLHPECSWPCAPVPPPRPHPSAEAMPASATG